MGADKVITNNVQIAAPQCDNYANAEKSVRLGTNEKERKRVRVRG